MLEGGRGEEGVFMQIPGPQGPGSSDSVDLESQITFSPFPLLPFFLLSSFVVILFGELLFSVIAY